MGKNWPAPAGPDVETAAIRIEVGSGELLDKITILQIKAERIRDPGKLAHVQEELASLEAARAAYLGMRPELVALEAQLRGVNMQLWDIEDDIREHEARGDFGRSFVELARAVYRTNDLRAALKKRINLATGARIVEEKSYAG